MILEPGGIHVVHQHPMVRTVGDEQSLILHVHGEAGGTRSIGADTMSAAVAEEQTPPRALGQPRCEVLLTDDGNRFRIVRHP